MHVKKNGWIDSPREKKLDHCHTDTSDMMRIEAAGIN